MQLEYQNLSLSAGGRHDRTQHALLKEIAQGYRTWMPGGARKAVELLATQVQGESSKGEMAKILEDVRKTLPAGTSLDVVKDAGRRVRNSVRTVEEALFLGAILTVEVV